MVQHQMRRRERVYPDYNEQEQSYIGEIRSPSRCGSLGRSLQKMVIASSEPKCIFLLTILQGIFCLVHYINYHNHQIMQNTSVFVCCCCCRIQLGTRLPASELNRIEQRQHLLRGPPSQGVGWGTVEQII